MIAPHAPPVMRHSNVAVSSAENGIDTAVWFETASGSGIVIAGAVRSVVHA